MRKIVAVISVPNSLGGSQDLMLDPTEVQDGMRVIEEDAVYDDTYPSPIVTSKIGLRRYAVGPNNSLLRFM